MRTLGLMNLAYGTAGMSSAHSLQTTSGMTVSLYIIGIGALMFLGFVPSIKTLYAHAKSLICKEA